MSNNDTDHPRSSTRKDKGEFPDTLQPYAGRWVAFVGDKIVGQGGTPEQAFSLAKTARFKESFLVEYVPPQTPLTFTPVLNQIRKALPHDQEAYLVGGAVRDALMGCQIRDLDIVVPFGAITIARRVANRLGGAFYPLDTEHDTGRVLLSLDNSEKFVIDFFMDEYPLDRNT